MEGCPWGPALHEPGEKTLCFMYINPQFTTKKNKARHGAQTSNRQRWKQEIRKVQGQPGFQASWVKFCLEGECVGEGGINFLCKTQETEAETGTHRCVVGPNTRQQAKDSTPAERGADV